MNGADLIAAFRSEVRDEVEPYLWSPEEVISYATAAQEMFCRLTGGLADASSALTTLALDVGDEFTNISPKILKLRAARDAATGRDIELLNYEDLQLGGGGFTSDYGNITSGFRLDATQGAVRHAVVGMEPNKIRWLAIPAEAQTVKLVVYRMPLDPVTDAEDLEIDEHHQPSLLSWMKHLAHRKQDAETFDKGRSDLFRDEFREYCRQAKEERERREHKFRTVAYGGY